MDYWASRWFIIIPCRHGSARDLSGNKRRILCVPFLVLVLRTPSHSRHVQRLRSRITVTRRQLHCYTTLATLHVTVVLSVMAPPAAYIACVPVKPSALRPHARTSSLERVHSSLPAGQLLLRLLLRSLVFPYLYLTNVKLCGRAVPLLA